NVIETHEHTGDFSPGTRAPSVDHLVGGAGDAMTYGIHLATTKMVFATLSISSPIMNACTYRSKRVCRAVAGEIGCFAATLDSQSGILVSRNAFCKVWKAILTSAKMASSLLTRRIPNAAKNIATNGGTSIQYSSSFVSPSFTY